MVIAERHAGDTQTADDARHPVVAAVDPVGFLRHRLPERLDAAAVDPGDDRATLVGGEGRVQPVVGHRQIAGQLAGPQIRGHPQVGEVAPIRPARRVEERLGLAQGRIPIGGFAGEQVRQRRPEHALADRVAQCEVAIAVPDVVGVATGDG
ncbi:MAG: hypothetical protein EBZ59_06770 [Planctomycetia bacterium]|nr:hypothetical protein [Planctomycetia bacterium]